MPNDDNDETMTVRATSFVNIGFDRRMVRISHLSDGQFKLSMGVDGYGRDTLTFSRHELARIAALIMDEILDSPHDVMSRVMRYKNGGHDE